MLQWKWQLFCFYVAVKTLLTDLKPDTVYRIQVAAATESIVSRTEYFVGPYSPVEEIRTLGEWESVIQCCIFILYVMFEASRSYNIIILQLTQTLLWLTDKFDKCDAFFTALHWM